MTASTPPVGVTVTATHVVHSKHPTLLQDPFILGPFDQLGHFATPINAVWIYEPLSSGDLVPLEKLRNAISRLLDYYPHLTGRMHIDPNTGVRTMTRIGSGIHLLEAKCNASLQSFARGSSKCNAQFSVFDFPNAGNALLAPWELSLDGTQQDPVFTIQRTEFACSSVAIGMRLSHVVAGAGGFLGLHQDLAAIYRATTTNPAIEELVELASPPCLTPFMVTSMQHIGVEEPRKTLTESLPGYSLQHDLDHDNGTRAETHAKNEERYQNSLKTDPIVGRSLRFSPEVLATLKSRAVDPNEGSDARVSAFTALSAHLWQRIHLARLARADSDDEREAIFSRSAFLTSVNFAPHLGLPGRMFGNTMLTPSVDLDSTKLGQAPLWELSKTINHHIRNVSVDEVYKLGSWIAAQPKMSDIQLDLPVTPSSFIATGWHRFPLYRGAELDVAPTFASPIFMDALFDGMVCFTEANARDGSVEAVASLRSSTWDHLDQDVDCIFTWG